MKKITIYRLSFRLTSKDADLLWLDADARFKMTVLVKQAVRSIMNGQDFQIPLPSVPQKSALKAKIVGVRFYKDEDEDVVEWLKKIEKGSRGFIIKRVLRHALEIVDYRPYLTGENTIEIIVPAKRPMEVVRSPDNSYDSSGLLKSATDELPQDESDEDDGGSDWLSAFSMLADQ